MGWKSVISLLPGGFGTKEDGNVPSRGAHLPSTTSTHTFGTPKEFKALLWAVAWPCYDVWLLMGLDGLKICRFSLPP